MEEFHVSLREIHTQVYSIMAEDAETAARDVLNGNGIAIGEPDYVATEDDDELYVEDCEIKQGGMVSLGLDCDCDD
jgi:hypothetical protein